MLQVSYQALSKAPASRSSPSLPSSGVFPGKFEERRLRIQLRNSRVEWLQALGVRRASFVSRIQHSGLLSLWVLTRMLQTRMTVSIQQPLGLP